jgi:hypothetical protein
MTYKQQYLKDILGMWLCDDCKEDSDGLAMIILYELGIDPYSNDEIVRIDWNNVYNEETKNRFSILKNIVKDICSSNRRIFMRIKALIGIKR